MPLTRMGAQSCRWLLAAAYVLLVLALQPLLLDHAFAAGSSHGHSDRDFCAWLDHAAGAGVHAAAPSAVLHVVALTRTPHLREFLLSVDRVQDPVRGPPSLLS
ncbi:MAG: hypothetical protein AB1555_17265 [Nitrospirota bacterium]